MLFCSYWRLYSKSTRGSNSSAMNAKAIPRHLFMHHRCHRLRRHHPFPKEGPCNHICLLMLRVVPRKITERFKLVSCHAKACYRGRQTLQLVWQDNSQAFVYASLLSSFSSSSPSLPQITVLFGIFPLGQHHKGNFLPCRIVYWFIDFGCPQSKLKQNHGFFHRFTTDGAISWLNGTFSTKSFMLVCNFLTPIELKRFLQMLDFLVNMYSLLDGWSL